MDEAGIKNTILGLKFVSTPRCKICVFKLQKYNFLAFHFILATDSTLST